MRYSGRILLCLLCGPCFSLIAQSYTVVESVRLPAQSYVGDAVELRYRIRTESVTVEPGEIDDPAWGTISQTIVQPYEDGVDLRLTVIPFETGTLALPDIDLGGISISGLSVVVSSVLADDDRFRPILGPQRLPGTRAAMIVVAVALAALIAALFYLLGPGREHLLVLIAGYRARMPYKRFRKQIALLEAQRDQLNAREFYIGLVSTLRNYLSAVLRVDCRAATTHELIGYLPALASLCATDLASVKVLEPVLLRADDAKFAGAEWESTVLADDLARCREMMETLEANRNSRRPRRSQRRRMDAGV